MELNLPLDSMTVADKLMAIETIWDSLRLTEGQVPVPQWHLDVLNERVERLESGKATLLDWEDVKSRLNQLGK